MSRKSSISAIITMMEMGPDPVSMGGQDAMAGIEIGMQIMPGDEEADNVYDDDECGFYPDDYVLAKQLVAQVGSVERARELLENLDEVYETLDMHPDGNDEDSIAFIAGHVPDDIDTPTSIGGF